MKSMYFKNFYLIKELDLEENLILNIIATYGTVYYKILLEIVRFSLRSLQRKEKKLFEYDLIKKHNGVYTLTERGRLATSILDYIEREEERKKMREEERKKQEENGKKAKELFKKLYGGKNVKKNNK